MSAVKMAAVCTLELLVTGMQGSVTQYPQYESSRLQKIPCMKFRVVSTVAVSVARCES